MIYQLILIDEKSGQPQKVSTVRNSLDMTDPLQRKLYVNTLNALTPNEEIIHDEMDGDVLVVRFSKKGRPQTTKVAPVAEIYEPEQVVTPNEEKKKETKREPTKKAKAKTKAKTPKQAVTPNKKKENNKVE